MPKQVCYTTISHIYMQHFEGYKLLAWTNASILGNVCDQQVILKIKQQ